jgi:hypothetical protein
MGIVGHETHEITRKKNTVLSFFMGLVAIHQQFSLEIPELI